MAKIDVDEIARAVGRAIAKRRQEKNLTQEQVAESLGVGNEAVSRIERGTVTPSVSRLIEIAEVLQCRAEDLLTEASSRPSDQIEQLAKLLNKVKDPDRKLILELVDKLVGRFVAK